jgi:hypothetical protein
MVDPSLAEPGSPEEELLRQIDPRRLPRHVAVIMDGNGRWNSGVSMIRTAVASRRIVSQSGSRMIFSGRVVILLSRPGGTKRRHTPIFPNK